MIRLMCVPYSFGAMRAGVGLPRLHGLEQVLQENREAAASAGNGRAAAARPVMLGTPFLNPPWALPAVFEPLRWPY
jgi:hypothetical protein